MTQTLIIPNGLPDLNQYTNACRSHWSKGAKMKEEADDIVFYESKRQKLSPVGDRCFIEYHWYCKNKKKDKSNIAAMGIKCIEDGLQKADILSQDNWEAIVGFSNHFYIDRENPRIEIYIQYD